MTLAARATGGKIQKNILQAHFLQHMLSFHLEWVGVKIDNMFPFAAVITSLCWLIHLLALLLTYTGNLRILFAVIY